VDIQKGKPLDEEPASPARWMLHSPLSPLTPSSPLYPDGLLSPDWMKKHQHQVPAVFIAFYDFTSDPNLNSLNDNQLKSDINALKKALADSDYRTRLSIVLLGDKAAPETAETEERISTIRKMTNLDAKTGLFYLPPKASGVDITKFAAGTLTSILPACIEYYRELTKHTRRKKNRGSVPDPTIPSNKATSHPLSTVAWNIRYDVKLGVFSEIRQEMEGACRHYTSALEALMGSEGVFETTPSWSPRWDEGRMLADVMALRIIRCLLWSQLTTTATQSWVNYRDRIRELVDRRGKGSSNFGWEAWESRWAKVMAELIQRADIPGMKITDSVDMTASTILSQPESAVYMPPEKSLGLDRLYPWHHLHHPGYWMRLSTRSAKRRRRYAMEIPEEDRTPPGMSPASTMAKRSGTYATYLCPEPHEEANASGDGFDHSADIIDRLQLSARVFSEKGQSRFAERIKLEIGRELLRKGDYKDAVRLLKAVWDDCSWRREKWWIPLYELNRALAEGARACADIPALVSTVFEMHSPHLRLRRDTRLDLMACSRGLAVEEKCIKVPISPGSVMSFRKYDHHMIRV
jgi:solute carrier family 25 protein 38